MAITGAFSPPIPPWVLALIALAVVACEEERFRVVGRLFLLAYTAVSLPAVTTGVHGLHTTFIVFGATVILACMLACGPILHHRSTGQG
jgi:hypothetical protein